MRADGRHRSELPDHLLERTADLTQLLRTILQEEALGLLDPELIVRILQKLTALPALDMKPVYRAGIHAYTKNFLKTCVTKLVVAQNATLLSKFGF